MHRDQIAVDPVLYPVRRFRVVVLHKMNIRCAHLQRLGQHVALELVEQKAVVDIAKPLRQRLLAALCR